MTETVTPEQPNTNYEVVKVLFEKDDEGVEQRLTLVKLSQPYLGRDLVKSEYYKVTHVVVGTSRIQKELGGQSYTYEETTVMGSEEDGSITAPVVLYLVNRVLPIEHALFAIGQV